MPRAKAQTATKKKVDEVKVDKAITVEFPFSNCYGDDDRLRVKINTDSNVLQIEEDDGAFGWDEHGSVELEVLERVVELAKEHIK
jgi:hypothetical protein